MVLPMQGIIVDSVTEQSLQTVTVGHADALEVFRRFVRPDGRRAAQGDAPVGVCRIASTAASDLLPVDTSGIVQVEAGAAIALGPAGATPVKAAADGRAIPVGLLDPDPVAAIALAAASAAGAYVPVLLQPSDAGRTMTIEHDDTNQVLMRFVSAEGKRCLAGEQQIGVALTASEADGDPLRVQVSGIATVLSGASVVLAQGSRRVMTDGQGRAVPAAGNVPAAGLALDAATAADEPIRVLLGI